MAKKKSPASRAPRVKHRRRRSPQRRSAVPLNRKTKPQAKKQARNSGKTETLRKTTRSAIKVGFIYPNDPNAIFLDRMRALESQQFEAHAIYWHRASDLSHPCSVEPFAADRFTRVNLPDPCAGVLTRIWLSFVFACRIRKWVSKNDFPVLHVVYPNMLIAAFLATLGRKVEIVYDIWDVDYGQSMPWWHRWLYRLLLSKTKQVFTTSEAFRDWIRSNKILKPNTEITHISNAPYDVRSNAALKVPRATTVKTGPLVIGCVGNLRVPKQLQMLFDAVQQVRATGRDIRIRLSGAGSRKQLVTHAAGEYDFVEYTGPFDFQRDGGRLYQALDVVYAVYPLEIFNYRVHVARRLHDAIRAATPIVVARNSHMGKIVVQEKVGWQIDHNSTEDLVRLLTDLHDNRDSVMQASSNAVSVVAQHAFAAHRQDYVARYRVIANQVSPATAPNELAPVRLQTL